MILKARGRSRTLGEAVEINAKFDRHPLIPKAHGRSRTLNEAVEMTQKSMKIH